MSSNSNTASNVMTVIQSVLDKLEDQYPDTSDEHLNIVLDILLKLKNRFIDIIYDKSVLIHCRGKNDRFIIHYFPDSISKNTGANDIPFYIQIFSPTDKILYVQTLEELLALLNKY